VWKGDHLSRFVDHDDVAVPPNERKEEAKTECIHKGRRRECSTLKTGRRGRKRRGRQLVLEHPHDDDDTARIHEEK